LIRLRNASVFDAGERTPMVRLVLVLLAAFALSSAQAAPPTSASGSTGAYIPIYADYEPKEINSLRALPAEIRSRVVAHIQRRVGHGFYRRLTFTGGLIVDLRKLRQSPRSKDVFRQEVPAYRLFFQLSMPNVGIRSYDCGIELRQDGSVINELSLPAFGSDRRKQHFVPLAAAYEIALARGFSPDRSNVEIIYNKKRDAMMWHLFQQVHHEFGLTRYRDVEINAHTGEVLRVYNTETEL
jgi:hypothetical protein